jgi:hypothetical protein
VHHPAAAVDGAALLRLLRLLHLLHLLSAAVAVLLHGVRVLLLPWLSGSGG